MNSGQQPWTSESTPDSPPPQQHPNVSGPIPRWAWAFVVACIAIPVSTLGGVLWIALGAGSAFACTNVARDETRPLKTRLIQCSAITIICWILFLLVVGGVSRLQAR